MITSPGESTPRSSSIVSSVGLPEGTMIHTARGVCVNFATISASELAPVAPPSTLALTASALRSYATTECPPRIKRVAMLAPMRPRPTIPTCITLRLCFCGQCVVDERVQRPKAAVDVALEMNEHAAAVALVERLQVA